MTDIDDLSSIGMGPDCPDCGQPMDWLVCWNGCDEGYFTYEEHLQYEDPLWYDPGDEEMCQECQGHGGWWRCGEECRRVWEHEELKEKEAT